MTKEIHLLDEIYGLNCDIGRLEHEVSQLKVENVKLREFAAEAWELLTCNEPTFVWNNLQDEARKLGIGVE